MDCVQYKMDSPVGPLFLIASDKGLKGIYWSQKSIKLVQSLNRRSIPEKILDDTRQQLTEYFSNKRQCFDLPLDMEGTVFQKKVWEQLLKIPFGKTVSYSDIAKRINNAKAVRAVGSANGKNPICIIVPCHRVIAANGSIAGYAGGVHNKGKLLDLEKARETTSI